MSSLRVLSHETPTHDDGDWPLEPTPNVTESEQIWDISQEDKTPPITDFVGAGPIKILTHYRGNMVYCAGCVSIHRVNSSTAACNGYSPFPPPGTVEDVILSSIIGKCRARIRFE